MKKLLLTAVIFLSTSSIAHAQVDPSSCANYNPPLVYDATKQLCVTSGSDSTQANIGSTGTQTNTSSQTSSSNSTATVGGIGTTNGTGAVSTQTQTTATPAATGATNASGKLPYTPLEPLPGGTSTSYNSLSAYLALMFNILLSLGAMIAVVSLVLGGITYMISEVVDKKNAARRRIMASFIGLGLLLTSWLILYTINPNLVKLCILSLDQQCGGTTGNGANGGGLPIAAQNPTPNSAQLAQQEAACKAKGPTYAFYVDTSGTSCYDLNY